VTSTLPERSLSPSAVLDARRLATLVEGLAAGTEAVPPRRARAIDEWTGRWCVEVRAQREHDDAVLELIDGVRRGTGAGGADGSWRGALGRPVDRPPG
jgi:hypothetical protein